MCVEAHVFEGAATAVVFSSGVELTAGQTARMNNYVHEHGLGLGAVFVHTITLTDVANNGLVNIVLVLSFLVFYIYVFYSYSWSPLLLSSAHSQNHCVSFGHPQDGKCTSYN